MAAFVALVPSVVAVVVYDVARLVDRRAGDVVHSVLVVLIGALFGNILVRGLGNDGTPLAVVATLAGGAGAVALVRTRPGRLLLGYLAGANVLFLVAFVFASPVSDLLFEKTDPDALGAVSVPEPPGPVVFVVFDELPLPTLVKPDGTINAERYPSFARLAAGSTWFRNASSLENHTERAVPAIATGSVIEGEVLPTAASFPRNLLALLGTAMPVSRYEPVTDLCPRTVCPPRQSQSLRQALSDSFVVYQHRVLPSRLREGLPRIDESWGGFEDVGGGTDASDSEEVDLLAEWHTAGAVERDPATQIRRLEEHAQTVDAPGFHFLHVVVPHIPWALTPWNTRLMRPLPPLDNHRPDPDVAAGGLYRYQFLSLQMGATDAALGTVLDRLEESGAWEDTTLVVLADHGTSTIPPHVGRESRGDNDEEIFRIPLFVKTPGQDTAEVVDDVALTIDVLPTLIDVLDIETDWELDGHSLLDGSEGTVEPIVRPTLDGLFEVVNRHAADFPFGWDWAALAAVGDQGALVGREVADLTEGDPSALTWDFVNEEAFAKVPNARGQAPQFLMGTVRGSSGEPPPIVVALNGTIAAVPIGYEKEGDDAWSSAPSWVPTSNPPTTPSPPTR